MAPLALLLALSLSLSLQPTRPGPTSSGAVRPAPPRAAVIGEEWGWDDSDDAEDEDSGFRRTPGDERSSWDGSESDHYPEGDDSDTGGSWGSEDDFGGE